MLLSYITLGCRSLVGLAFAASAISKLYKQEAYRNFGKWLKELPFPFTQSPLTLVTIIAGEISVVLLVANPWTATAGLALAIMMLAIFTQGIWIMLRSRIQTTCQCFGPSTTPLGAWHIGRNGLLLAGAITGLVGTLAHQPQINALAVLLTALVTVAATVLIVLLPEMAELFSSNTSD
jgi:hypothetical protein